MAFQLCIFVAFLFFYSRPGLTEANGNQVSKSYNGGHCTTDKQGTYRITIQYCNGKEWLTMQPGEQSVVQPKKDLSKVLGNTVEVKGKSCNDIKKKGLDRGDGEYMIDPDGGSDKNAFNVYCDMTSFGGGWTMCYTTDNHVDIKKEVSSKIAYGDDGYRADCNNIPFTDVMFVDEKTKKKAYFTKTAPAITFSSNYDKGASTYGLWNGHGVASDSLKYQLMICDTSFYKGLHVSGYKSCYKRCDEWCSDTTTPYFRTAAVTNGAFAGVSFNVVRHKAQGKYLISAGIR